jgi:hypothetical protein
LSEHGYQTLTSVAAGAFARCIDLDIAASNVLFHGFLSVYKDEVVWEREERERVVRGWEKGEKEKERRRRGG